MVIQSKREPAPLDPAALEVSLRPFGHSRMLPTAAYTDPAVFAWEQDHFFADGWMCVGHSEDMAEPGDQRPNPSDRPGSCWPGARTASCGPSPMYAAIGATSFCPAECRTATGG